jgi:cobalt-precorrin 5A hydrolase
MATGIMVRNICPLIKNKIEDPAVLVMDDQGKYIISLLSGHFGGANDIALKIAGITGVEPVITTATDVHSKMGIDSLARKYYLSIDDYKNIKAINSALIQNKKVDLYIPPKYEFIFKDPEIKTSYNKHESSNNELKAVYEENSINLKPKKLVFGIGARKGESKNRVQNAINEAIKLLKLSPERIDTLATGEMKENEEGIVQTAHELNIPLEIVTVDKIKSLNHPDCSTSEFVEKKFGVPGICEPAALIAAGKNSKLIFKKTAYDGVTVAVAVSYE